MRGGKKHKKTVIPQAVRDNHLFYLWHWKICINSVHSTPTSRCYEDKCDCLCRVLCVSLAPLLRTLPEVGAVIVTELSCLGRVLLHKRCKSTKPNFRTSA